MVTAIVLITCEVDRTSETAETLADLAGISEVYSVAGDWDLAAIVRVGSHDDLAATVTRPRPSSTSRVVCEPVNGSSPVPVCEVPPAAVPPEDDPVLMSMAMRDGLLSSSTLNGTRWSTPRP